MLKDSSLACSCIQLYSYIPEIKVSRSKVASSFFIDDIFYVVIVFKIHEIIYLRKGQYITGDILYSHGQLGQLVLPTAKIYFILYLL
jgi:hypothetical protein